MALKCTKHVLKDKSVLTEFCGKFVTDLASKAIKERGVFTIGKLLLSFRKYLVCNNVFFYMVYIKLAKVCNFVVYQELFIVVNIFLS